MLKSLEISGFKSFANKSTLEFDAPISAIVGPNGSGKSNTAEAFRFVLGEQSLKALRVSKTDELLFNGGQSGRRKNRAHVKAQFDNSADHLDVEYDEVVVERLIERGDASTYRLNGSQVRLRDVTDLLADANIGTSRHHIISQGEADRVLNVSKRDRKTIIEDALGLRRFYRRRREAQNKLDQTEDNLADIQTRLDDIKPEFKYLKKKKRQIEKTKELREELTQQYQEYFYRRELLIKHKSKQLKEEQASLEDKLQERKDKIAKKQQELEQTQETDKSENEEAIQQAKKQLQATESEISELTQQHGEVAGRITTLQQQLEKQTSQENNNKKINVSQSKINQHKEGLQELIADAAELEFSDFINQLQSALDTFFAIFADSDDQSEDQSAQLQDKIENFKNKKQEIEKERDQLEAKRKRIKDKIADLESESASQETKQHQLEKQLLQLESKQETTQAKLKNCTEKLEQVASQKEQLEEEKSEAKVLCGEQALEYEDITVTDDSGGDVSDDEIIQEGKNRSFGRKLERLKIKLEETRVSDPEEIRNEFDRVKERIEFFQREIEDLEQTRARLEELIADIEATAEKKFAKGIEQINQAFGDFFATMFGGGSAQLTITEHPAGRNVTTDAIEETPEETEQGVAIQVQLPNKKVRGLEVLSGGERALTSIALLFALSQINPPPFVVLDEADAALDEANSKRFGDIIERLSEHSQLIIITHNRETMRRADLLYGVTMDQNGSSRLLSLDFSEAVDTIEQ
jgi:chromosome segregation protein